MNAFTARLSVHVQSVIEKFPHDALVSLENASDINETTLSSSISAPKPSNSTTSTESHKPRRRLTEIVEDVGETPLQLPTAAAVDPPGQLVKQEQDHTREPSTATITTETGTKRAPSIEEASRVGWLNKYNTSSSLAGKDTITSGPSASPSDKSKTGTRFEISTLASSDSLADLYKPKIKVAPRPSLEKRHSGSFIRPVAALPASIRLGKREPDTMPRPQTQQTHSKPFFAIPNVHTNGSAVSVYNAPTFDRPVSRSGSAATAPAHPRRHAEQSTTVTPEKQRLMKALQKRKKDQIAKANLEAARASSVSKESEKSADKKANGASAGPDKESSIQNGSQVLRDGARGSGVEPSHQTHAEKQTDDPNRSIGASTLNARASETSDVLIASPRSDATTPDGKAFKDDPSSPQSIETHSQISSNGLISIEEMVSQGSQSEPLHSQAKDFMEDESLSVDAALPPGSPEEIPLPPQDDAEKDLLGSRDIREAEEVKSESPTIAPTEQSLEPSQKEEKSADLITASIQYASESTLDRKQKPPPLTPARHEEHSRPPSLSDESLLEELQSATVEEAKSVSLSKTPTTPFSSTSPRRIDTRRSSEASRKRPQLENDAPPTPTISPRKGGVSRLYSDSEIVKSSPEPTSLASSPMPLRPTIATHTSDSVAALSRRTGLAHSNSGRPEEQDRPASKKSAVSSLISQRIKAFESFSSSKSPSNAKKTVVTPTFVNIRKASLNTPPTSAQDDWGGNKSHFLAQTGYPTPSPSPHGFSTRLFGKSSAVNSDRKENPISISTAIITSNSASSMDSKSVNGEVPSIRPAAPSKRSSFFGSKANKSKSPSISSAASSKDGIVSSKTDASTSRLSFSSRRSSSDTQIHLRPQSAESITSDGEKKDSKKKRLFKRLSKISGVPHRSIAQTLNPTLNSQPIMESQEPSPTRKWSNAVTIGDVNVQFPDTLVSNTLPKSRLELTNSSSGNVDMLKSMVKACLFYLKSIRFVTILSVRGPLLSKKIRVRNLLLSATTSPTSTHRTYPTRTERNYLIVSCVLPLAPIVLT